MTAVERSLQARAAAHESWAKTENRSARTFNARKAMQDKFLTQANGDPIRAEHLRKAYYARLALKSAKVRRQRRGERAEESRRKSGAALAQLNWALS